MLFQGFAETKLKYAEQNKTKLFIYFDINGAKNIDLNDDVIRAQVCVMSPVTLAH